MLNVEAMKPKIFLKKKLKFFLIQILLLRSVKMHTLTYKTCRRPAFLVLVWRCIQKCVGHLVKQHQKGCPSWALARALHWGPFSKCPEEMGYWEQTSWLIDNLFPSYLLTKAKIFLFSCCTTCLALQIAGSTAPVPVGPLWWSGSNKVSARVKELNTLLVVRHYIGVQHIYLFKSLLASYCQLCSANHGTFRPCVFTPFFLRCSCLPKVQSNDYCPFRTFFLVLLKFMLKNIPIYNFILSSGLLLDFTIFMLST